MLTEPLKVTLQEYICITDPLLCDIVIGPLNSTLLDRNIISLSASLCEKITSSLNKISLNSTDIIAKQLLRNILKCPLT